MCEFFSTSFLSLSGLCGNAACMMCCCCCCCCVDMTMGWLRRTLGSSRARLCLFARPANYSRNYTLSGQIKVLIRRRFKIQLRRCECGRVCVISACCDNAISATHPCKHEHQHVPYTNREHTQPCDGRDNVREQKRDLHFPDALILKTRGFFSKFWMVTVSYDLEYVLSWRGAIVGQQMDRSSSGNQFLSSITCSHKNETRVDLFPSPSVQKCSLTDGKFVYTKIANTKHNKSNSRRIEWNAQMVKIKEKQLQRW